MHWGLSELWAGGMIAQVPAWLDTTYVVLKVIIGFSLIIFVHELGHFLAAKWVGIRVDRFAIGFGPRLFGWRQGEGFTLGGRPSYSLDELQERQWGETDYCFKLLPLGGYVKMLGQDDIQVNDDTGEVKMSDDPRAFNNKPVGKRMIVVSAGVLFNLFFAILVFMCVYMMGKRTLAPQIGVLDANSPAAQAGLRSGDVVVEANGRKVEAYRDIAVALVLAEEGDVAFRVRRDGEVLPEELHVKYDKSAEEPLDACGLSPFLSTEIMDAVLEPSDLYGLQPRDHITQVGGRPVRSATDVLLAFSRLAMNERLSKIEVTYERPDPEHADETTTHTTTIPVTYRLSQAQVPATSAEAADMQHVLGFYPRQRVVAVEPGQPAEQAGLRTGDVILQWGSVLHPRYPEILASVEANANKPIPIIVLRDGERVELTVTPRRPFQLTGTAQARAGLGFGHEERRPVVADTADNSPAARLSIPRGALLVSVDGRSVEDWFDVIRALMAAAGKTVPLTYRVGDVETTGPLVVPSSVVNELDLPSLARILAINGETEIELADGAVAGLPNWVAVGAMLSRHAGQTVNIRYQRAIDELTLEEANFHVRADLTNVDPWQMRIILANPDLPFKPRDFLLQTNNPVRAAWLGITATGRVLSEVYDVLKRLTRNRSNTARHVAGPVGIVSAALQRARVGYAELLFFLAFLSVNLAVINFLPFPVVDGGLMVFLVIEKIKGKPLSIKTQMIATLVGLATIVLVFLLVTIQDITKFFR